MLCMCEVVSPEGAPEPMGPQVKCEVKVLKVDLSLGCSYRIISTPQESGKRGVQIKQEFRGQSQKEECDVWNGKGQRSVGVLERSWKALRPVKEWATPPLCCTVSCKRRPLELLSLNLIGSVQRNLSLQLISLL